MYFNQKKQEKDKLLLENKNKVLNTANVLLISDIQEDYNELINYGFKNVDYFKSIIRADKYFAEHPEELEKYHIILKGNQNVQRCCFNGEVELDRKIEELKDKKNILALSLNIINYPDHVKFITHLSDTYNHKSWFAKELSYPCIFDRIVENALINHIVNNVDLKNKKFEKIQDYINPNRLPLPTKKSDLKILYLEYNIGEYAEELAKTLGLNITFKEDNNCSLGKYIKSNLGDYDIIIVNSNYSGNLLSMNYESTEQCKDTGRELTLFVSQEDLYWGFRSGLIDEKKLRYVFGGTLAPDSKCHSKDIKILRQRFGLEVKDIWSQWRYFQMKDVIEASVILYNQSLIQIGKPSLSDLDFTSTEELEQDKLMLTKKKQ